MMTPLTSAEKQARRLMVLDELARALEFTSWSELATQLKRAYQENTIIEIRIGKERRNTAKGDKIKTT